MSHPSTKLPSFLHLQLQLNRRRPLQRGINRTTRFDRFHQLICLFLIHSIQLEFLPEKTWMRGFHILSFYASRIQIALRFGFLLK